MVLNCGSASCPRLPQKWMESTNVEETLDRATRNFINRDGGMIVQEQGEVNCVPLLLSCIYNIFISDL